MIEIFLSYLIGLFPGILIMIISEIKLLPFALHLFTTSRYNVFVDENLVTAFEAMQKYHMENPDD